MEKCERDWLRLIFAYAMGLCIISHFVGMSYAKLLVRE